MYLETKKIKIREIKISYEIKLKKKLIEI